MEINRENHEGMRREKEKKRRREKRLMIEKTYEVKRKVKEEGK